MKITQTVLHGLMWLSIVCAPALAAELSSRTSAAVLDSDGRQARTGVDVVAHVVLEQPPLLSRDRVIVSWERVGGVEPQPFRLAIPAGCFVASRGAFVVDGVGCGIDVTLDGARVSADSFAARLVPPEPVMPGDPYRLRIRLDVIQGLEETGALLSTLGGATVTAQVGAERGVSPASDVLSKSGVDPNPF